jgi:threonine dehydratase
MTYAISIADIRAAAAAISGQVLATPTLPSPRLSAATGAEIYVKYETLQATGAFKERGALNRLLALTEEERRRGVVSLSAGNHAQAVAYHARRLGIPATIVMPRGTPMVKVENTRGYGATVVLEGDTLEEASREVERILARDAPVLVHPYDDPAVMAGQGTIALEMLAAVPDLDTLVVPVGGGGLFSGMAVAARAINPSIRLVGVEAQLYPSFRNAVRSEERPVGGATLAEGIAVKTPGRLTLPIVRDLADDIVLVSEEELETGINAFATLARCMAEGAGAAGLAAILADPAPFQGRKVGLVLCGGNIDARLVAAIMVRALERDRKIVSFRLTIVDRPGMLGAIASRLGELGANILEVSHGRLFLDVPAKGVSLDVTIEARDGAHAQSVIAALASEGWNPRFVERMRQATSP